MLKHTQNQIKITYAINIQNKKYFKPLSGSNLHIINFIHFKSAGQSTHFGKYTELCSHHHNPISDIPYRPPRTHGHLKSILLLIQPQATTDLLCVSTDLLFLDISYKWNYAICIVLQLASFTQHHFSTFVCRGMSQNTVPFPCCVVSSCTDIPLLVTYHNKQVLNKSLYSRNRQQRLLLEREWGTKE